MLIRCLREVSGDVVPVCRGVCWSEPAVTVFWGVCLLTAGLEDWSWTAGSAEVEVQHCIAETLDYSAPYRSSTPAALTHLHVEDLWTSQLIKQTTYY